ERTADVLGSPRGVRQDVAVLSREQDQRADPLDSRSGRQQPRHIHGAERAALSGDSRQRWHSPAGAFAARVARLRGPRVGRARALRAVRLVRQVREGSEEVTVVSDASQKRPESLVLGIDGGASNTTAILAEAESGRVLGRGAGGPSNIQAVG